MTKLLHGYSCLYAKCQAGSHFHTSSSDIAGKKIAGQLTGKNILRAMYTIRYITNYIAIC